MIREIKFRAKSLQEKKWVFGFYVYYITPEEGQVHSLIDDMGRWITIDPQTLGQYIRRNENNKELYEGDILECHGDTMMIVYTDGSYVARSLTKMWKNYYYKSYIKCNKIGNRFDNPELLNPII